MITLYVFGPAFGLPDPSPFVTKAEVLLKMSGLPYRTERADVRKAPKGKLPYIRDESGRIIADSTLIRFFLERERGIDFDEGFTPEQRGNAWMIEKFFEDHLYWVGMRERWTVDANFDRGPRQFFAPVPAPLRPLVIASVRREFRRNLWGQGLGRHTADEIESIAERGIAAAATYLSDRPFLLADRPCGADATLWAFTFGLMCPLFDSPTRAAAKRYANLVAYAERGRALWFPHIAPLPA